MKVGIISIAKNSLNIDVHSGRKDRETAQQTLGKSGMETVSRLGKQVECYRSFNNKGLREIAIEATLPITVF